MVRNRTPMNNKKENGKWLLLWLSWQTKLVNMRYSWLRRGALLWKAVKPCIGPIVKQFTLVIFLRELSHKHNSLPLELIQAFRLGIQVVTQYHKFRLIYCSRGSNPPATTCQYYDDKKRQGSNKKYRYFMANFEHRKVHILSKCHVITE